MSCTKPKNSRVTKDKSYCYRVQPQVTNTLQCLAYMFNKFLDTREICEKGVWDFENFHLNVNPKLCYGIFFF